jgi:hypothetical protein
LTLYVTIFTISRRDAGGTRGKRFALLGSGCGDEEADGRCRRAGGDGRLGSVCVRPACRVKWRVQSRLPTRRGGGRGRSGAARALEGVWVRHLAKV